MFVVYVITSTIMRAESPRSAIEPETKEAISCERAKTPEDTAARKRICFSVRAGHSVSLAIQSPIETSTCIIQNQRIWYTKAQKKNEEIIEWVYALEELRWFP